MRTANVAVELTTFGFAVRCSRCGFVAAPDATIFTDTEGASVPIWHARFKASEAMQAHQCADFNA